MNFRKATISDLAEMNELFVQTIQSICKNDYSPEQINVWISGAENTQRWIDVIQKQFVLLSVIQGKIVGFGTLKDNNHIDLFFIHKDFQRKGIANKIFNELELEAKKHHSRIITSDVSITAKPFFEKKGFVVKSEQKNMIKSIEIINYKMEKEL